MSIIGVIIIRWRRLSISDIDRNFTISVFVEIPLDSFGSNPIVLRVFVDRVQWQEDNFATEDDRSTPKCWSTNGREQIPGMFGVPAISTGKQKYTT